jgi:hypothetical protein
MRAPKSPNPYAVAAAQTAQNKETANYEMGLNMVNQVTPYGNLTYSGVNNGQPGSATATQTLSPTQQKLLDQSEKADFGMNDIALRQIDKVGGILDKPFQLGNEATEARLTELGSKRLDPRISRERQSLEQDMMNRGIRPGSEAYNNMVGRFDESKNDAYNQLYLTGRSQAANEMLAERNQPLNEIIGLLNGQQIQQPSFTNTPQTNVANTDLAGLIMDNYKTKQSGYNATMGGLFGLGGSLASFGGSYFGKK